MKKRIKIILVIGVVLVVVLASIYSALKPLSVEAEILALTDSELSFTETGYVTDEDGVSVYAEIPAKIVSVNVEEGDRINAGDVLALLDSSDIDFQIQQMHSMLEGYMAQKDQLTVENQSALDALKTSRDNLKHQIEALKIQKKMGTNGSQEQMAVQEVLIEQSKETWDRSVEDLEKYKSLLEGGIISQSEYQQMADIASANERSYEQALIGMESLKTVGLNDDYYDASIAALQAQLTGIDVSLGRDNLKSMNDYYDALIKGTEASLKGLENQKDKYRITAPASGVIGDNNLKNTNMVSALEPAFTLIGTQTHVVEVYINTRDIEAAVLGVPVTLIVDRRNGDIEIEGTILSVDEEATVKLSPLGVEERKVLVRIQPEKNDVLKKGYGVDVKFIIHGETGKVVVPNSALYKKDGKDMVLIIQDGRIAEAEVALGYEMTGETIVESGLKEGDVLITDLDLEGLKAGKQAVPVE